MQKTDGEGENLTSNIYEGIEILVATKGITNTSNLLGDRNCLIFNILWLIQAEKSDDGCGVLSRIEHGLANSQPQLLLVSL